MKPRGIILAIVAVAAATVPYPAPPEPDLTALPQVELQSALSPRPTERPGFLSFALDSPHAFVPVIGSDPERICDRLDEAGFANFGWRGAQISGIWECMARLEEAPVDISQDHGAESGAGEGEEDAAASPAKENSLFYLLRGTSRQRLAYARMKLNLLESRNEDEMLARAGEFLAALADAAGFRLPPEVTAAVLAKQAVTVRTKEATFKLKPEFDDPRRFNLSIEFGPALHAFHLSEYRTVGSAPDRRVEDGTVSAENGGNTLPDKQGRLRPDG